METQIKRLIQKMVKLKKKLILKEIKMEKKEEVLKALRKVVDPEIGKNIVDLGMVKDLTVEDDKVSFTLALTVSECPLKNEMKSNAEKVLKELGFKEVNITFGKLTEEEIKKIFPNWTGKPPILEKGNIKHLIAIGSGKGGVGKSTVVTNLAIALSKLGYRTGILDADIHGPNIPIMFGIKEKPYGIDNKIIPHERFGVRVMSLGFMMSGEGSPVIWRGPLVTKAIKELFQFTVWGDLDFLLIDLPPGTGDATITVGQSLPLTSAIVVTTPQRVAVSDALRSAKTFEKLNVKLLGVIENMSYFICPDSGKRYNIFGEGGGEAMSIALKVPLLGKIPMELDLREGGDRGEPITVKNPESASSKAFFEIAKKVVELTGVSKKST